MSEWPNWSTLRYDQSTRTLLIDGTDGLPISVATYVLPGFASYLLAKPEAGAGLPSASDLDIAADLLYKVGNGAAFGPTSRRLATRLAYHLNGQREPAAYAEAASPRSDAGSEG